MLSPQPTKARMLLLLNKKIILHHSALSNPWSVFPLSMVAFKNKFQLLLWTGIRAARNQAWHITLTSFNFSITIAEQTLFLWILWIHEMIPTDCLSIDFKFHEIQLISARLEYQYIETLQNQIVKAASSLRNTKTLLLP